MAFWDSPSFWAGLIGLHWFLPIAGYLLGGHKSILKNWILGRKKMDKDSAVLVLGGTGLVGSAITNKLTSLNYKNLLIPTREELNLFHQEEVRSYFERYRPEYVFMAAARVGGILANNTMRADFIFENLMIQNLVFESAHKYDVKKLLFLGSSCIYPKNAPQPMKETDLLTGPLEPTNEPYALAKIAGLKTAESFRRQYQKQFFSVQPCNLYGPGDHFDAKRGHVIPSLIRRMHAHMKEIKAKGWDPKKRPFEVWGSGTPLREFMYVDDLAMACLHLMSSSQELPDLINVGTGEEISIGDLAKELAHLMELSSPLVFNQKYPDGHPRKVLNIDVIKGLGWRATTSLSEGLKKTLEYYFSKN